MNEKYPYQVSHLSLENLTTPTLFDTENQGIYLIFWWKEIPLGHGIFDPNTRVSENDFNNKLIESIIPTLEFYFSKQNSLKNCNWELMILEGRIKDWEACMENLFSPWTTAAFPAQVPISVVICTRNRSNDLKRCLDSIMKMDSLPAEIIIIDNAPKDESTAELVKNFEKVKYFKEPRPGLSFARNRGVLESTHSIIAFTDDDVEVHKDWAFRVWETFGSNEKLFAITGLVLPKELKTSAQVVFEKSWTFNRGYKDKEYDATYWEKTLSIGPPVWKIGAGANMAFKKEIFESLGLFDVKLGAGASGCSEDSEMWYRILNHNYELAYCPRAVVLHKHRHKMNELKSQIFQYMKGHVVAALVQQGQNKKAGYTKYIYYKLPRYYLNKILHKSKNFGRNLKSVWNEINGIQAGISFYFKYYKN
ncbi:MAG: glycosyltransferase family A protein [Cyclobacteriaceae bacterium]